MLVELTGGGIAWVTLAGVDGGVGNSVEACWRASLMVLGMRLYVVWNFFGVNMTLVVGF